MTKVWFTVESSYSEGFFNSSKVVCCPEVVLSQCIQSGCILNIGFGICNSLEELRNISAVLLAEIAF